jgi:23S rRNA pseudouridine2457 synthase
LGELHAFPEDIMAIGILEKTSEGLLKLTTDGKLSEKIRSKKVDKKYYIQIDGLATKSHFQQLKKGVDIQLKGKTYRTLPFYDWPLKN